jgi:acyl dehydratase
MAYIENKTFDEIQIGEMAIIIRHLSNRDIEIFASVSGNQNPTHTDIEYMKSKSHGHLLGHGMWIGAVFSAILGMKLPGPGTRYISQTLQFHNSAKAGDTVTATARVLEKNAINNTVTLECTCVNQAGLSIASGIAEVIAPVEKIKRTVVELPSIILQEKEDEWYNQLIHLPDNTVPLITAIVHPVDETSLVGAVFAATENLIIPILVGPESRIRQKADELKLDISPYTIISTEHSHASAERAVQMARMGEVEALMKGNLHTDELLSFVVDRASGLRGNRRMSHVFAVQAPDYPKPIFLTDAALNIKPNLETKKDIVQNAVDLFTRIGHGIPKVAIVSAVETVTEKIPSTLDATALCGKRANYWGCC